MAGVQVHVIGVRLRHPRDDGPGHDISGRKIREIVDTLHEAHPVAVHQVGALAPYRFGDQRLLAARALTQPEHCRVELDEFEVGDHRARP
jgi:hypothetical protein